MSETLRKRVHSRYGDQRTPYFPRESYCVDYEDAVKLESALAAERSAHEATMAELAACRAERQNWMRALLESTLYPPPPYEVRLQADYFSGCTAYRAALLAAAKEPSDAG